MASDTADAPQATRAPLPTDPATFDADERVSFSKLSDKFILEAEDGQEFEWEPALKRWVPVLDDDLLEQQRQAYAVQGVDETEPVAQPGKKRKKNNDEPHNDQDGLVRKQKPRAAPRERKNTAVYVTNLPFDATAAELAATFSRCGVIAESMESKAPRVKLYADDQGRFKGDALVVYFRAESVDLAVQLLDDTELRLGGGGGEGAMGRMRVAPADFSFKTQKEAPAKQSDRERQRLVQKTQKLKARLADWDDDDPQALPTTTKLDKTVVLRHMFTMKELEADPSALLDIKDDIREECGKLGAVTNVILYDEEPDGIVTVRYADPVSAQACVRAMNGRFFGGGTVEAYIPATRERFRKSGKRADEDNDDDELLGSAAMQKAATGTVEGLDVGERGDGTAGKTGN